MRNRLLSLLTLGAFLFALSLTSQPLVMAQTADPESTPDAHSIDFGSAPVAETGDPGAAGEETSSQPAGPHFGIVAIGDHPTGYFDDIEVAPGTSVELTAAIINPGEIPVSLHTYKANALAASNGGFASGAEADAPIGATAWFDYPSFELELDPGEQQDVTFTATVPADAAPGQYISALAATTTESTPIAGSDILRQGRGYVISVGILVPGELTHAFELGEPTIDQPFLQIPVANTGTYLVRPSGEIVMTDADGNHAHTSMIGMGSVYAGLSTTIDVPLPEQMPPGDYGVSVSLTDEASGATGEIDDAAVTVPEPVDPTGVSATVSVEPNADPLAFANVTANLVNGGQVISAANVDLTVLRDGEEIERFPLAANLVLENGETEVTDRYIPANAWEPGTYTFQVVISAVDRGAESETILASIDISDAIVVP